MQYRHAFSADFKDQYIIVSEAPFSWDKAWELPAVLQLGNPDAIGLGQERLAVAGWPSVRGEHALHMDNGTLLSKPKDSHCKHAARQLFLPLFFFAVRVRTRSASYAL